MFKTILLCLACITLSATAQAELITFDVDQADFIAPAESSGEAGAVIVDDQFASIGVLFRDMDFPTQGVWVGNPNGPFSSSPNVLYSNNGSGSFDYLVRAELTFVDPNNIDVPAYVTSISGVFTDAGAGSTLTAYDMDDNVLGVSTAVSGNMETLSLSDIGEIARVEFVAQDWTALDDINFDGLVSMGADVPVPTMSFYGLVLMMLSLVYVASRRLRVNIKRT